MRRMGMLKGKPQKNRRISLITISLPCLGWYSVALLSGRKSKVNLKRKWIVFFTPHKTTARIADSTSPNDGLRDSLISSQLFRKETRCLSPLLFSKLKRKEWARLGKPGELGNGEDEVVFCLIESRRGSLVGISPELNSWGLIISFPIFNFRARVRVVLPWLPFPFIFWEKVKSGRSERGRRELWWKGNKACIWQGGCRVLSSGETQWFKNDSITFSCLSSLASFCVALPEQSRSPLLNSLFPKNS